jgi:LysM repeat protein/uncharacterized protein YvpB
MPSIGSVTNPVNTTPRTEERHQAPAHTVKSGETLSGIAADHNLALDDLVKANPQIRNPDLIKPGQEVRIPAATQAVPPQPAPAPAPTARPAGGSPTSRQGAAVRLDGGVTRQMPTASAAPAPSFDQVRQGAVMKRGQGGASVSELQRALTARGYGVKATGQFGPTTESVVQNFQRDHGLVTDGIVGRDTMKALDAKAGGTPAGSGRAMSTPVLNQHTSGSYPGGYCAITALRMTLRLEGKKDPGADSVALGGSRPYSPGNGSSGSLLAARAIELGLPNATYTTTGSLADIKAQLAKGHAVPIGGEGRFVGTYTDGRGTWDHSYRGGGHWMAVVGHDPATGNFIVNDPDRGARFSVTESDFRRFFTPDGPSSAWMISY